ncbi:MAG: hypothetical protein QOK04_1785 [Solirubrobacteraceae bacterium]|jgi:hypothetical protein|nr:hypothetical protein [Solirubrobacteraceae bacterium]
MRSGNVTAPVAMVAAMLVGCGEGGGGKSFSGEQGKVAAVAKRFADKAQHDPGGVCDLVSARRLPSFGGARCRQLVPKSKTLKDIGDGGFEVTSVTVSGATATAKTKDSDDHDTFKLVKEAGAWKVDDIV